MNILPFIVYVYRVYTYIYIYNRNNIISRNKLQTAATLLTVNDSLFNNDFSALIFACRITKLLGYTYGNRDIKVKCPEKFIIETFKFLKF